MSFGFSVGDFLAAIQLANKIRKEFANAPSQFNAISDEVRALSILLQDTDSTFPDQELNDDQKRDLEDIDKGCRNVLDELQEILDKNSELSSEVGSVGKRIKRVWKRLNWKPEDINELRSRISSNIGFLTAFNGQLVRDGVARLVRHQDNQEWQAILSWLTPIDFVSQQNDFITRRQEGTGQWLLDSAEFETWVRANKLTLFCPGIPGAGKTILTSIVVKELTTRFSNEPAIGLAYIYCNFRRQDEQKIDGMLASLLKQLAETRLFLPTSVKELYNRHKAKRTRPSLEEILEALHSVLTLCSRVFIFLDALDEVPFEERDKFLEAISSLQGRQAHVNIFATSRPEITSHFADYFEEYISKEIRATEDDLITYMNGKLSTIRRPRISKYPDLQNAIRREIVRAANGMFLHAKLYLDYLLSKPTAGDIKDALQDHLHGLIGLDTLYSQAMERINNQKEGRKENANKALSWIIHAKRPLKTAEIQHAISVRDKAVELKSEYLLDIEDLISDCAGLLTIDNETDIVRLVHYTTQEYFERTQKQWFPNAQADITTVCVTYLSFNEFEGGICLNDEEFEQRLQLNKLYNYAARNWGHHAREAWTLCQGVIEFLQQSAQVDASIQALITNKLWLKDAGYSQRFQRQMTGLHLSTYFGVKVIVQVLLEQGADIKAVDSRGWTPLHQASYYGNVEVVQLLLEQGADIKTVDSRGCTPLHQASDYGNVEVVRLLLEQGADIKAVDSGGYTPLHRASYYGHVEVVQLLLEQGADIKVVDSRGWTPLHQASCYGNVEVVRLLLKQGADIKVVDSSGETSLHRASYYGHVEVVRLLLKQGADIKAVDSRERTPLHHASSSDHVDVVEVLLEEGAIVESKDKVCRTPLLYAARNGKEAIIKLLLTTNRVNVDSVDYYNSTPLSIAARMGNKDALALLLTQSQGLDIKDNFGRSPLQWARKTGQSSIIDLILTKYKENGMIVREDDFPTATILVPSEDSSRYCDVCVLNISEEDTYYRCGVCNNGDFDICEECFALKARCLDEFHTLIRHGSIE